MKKSYYLIMALVISCNLFSQDIITKKNGDEIEAIVSEVGINDIKYKKYGVENSPTYTILKSEVFMIKYNSGHKDVFNEVNSETNSSGSLSFKKEETITILLNNRNELNVRLISLDKKTVTYQSEGNNSPTIISLKNVNSIKDFYGTYLYESDAIKYGQNIVFINPIHFAFGNLTVGYERISKEGGIGIEIPFSTGLVSQYLATGVNLKFYPSKQGKVKGFVGPSLLYGYDFSNKSNIYYGGLAEIKALGGVSFQPSRYINITANTGLGLGNEILKTRRTYFAWTIGVNVGYRF